MAKTVKLANVLESFVGMSKPTMVKEGDSYKCSLCKRAGDYASLVPHIQTHARNVLTYKGVEIYRCGLDCATAPHHHCCFCNKSVIIKICFERHLRRCEEDRMEETGIKPTWSSDQSSVKTTKPSRPLVNAPTMGIVVQTPAGPALLQTVASPVRLQGNAGGPLLLQASPLVLQATTTTASSPKQASTAKTAEETAKAATATTSSSTSTLKNTTTTASSQDETTPTPSSPSSAPQTPVTPSMDLDTLIDTTTDNTESQDIVSMLSELHPPLTETSSRQNSGTAPTVPAAKPTNRKGQATQSTNPASPPDTVPPAGAIPPVSPSEATAPATAPSKRRTTCPHCPTVLFKRNLKVHIIRHHKDFVPDAPNTTPQQQQQQQQQSKQKRPLPKPQKPRLMSVCVDVKNGILAVQRHSRGLLAPVHVRKKVRAGQIVRCDLKECQQFQRMAMRHGLTVTSCQHTQDLEQCKDVAAEEALRSESLDEMVVLKHMSDAKRTMCLRRQKMAQNAGVPFSVLVNFGGSPRHVFISIHEPKTHEFCFGRVMVSFNIDRNMWHCPCTKPHISCFHKNIAKWHIFQTNRDLIEPSESSSSKDSSRTGKGKSTNRSSNKSTQGDIKRSVDYIYDQKKIPAEIPEDLTHTLNEFPAHLFPVETTCEVCSHSPGLEESECITDQAKIVTMLGVADGVSTYVRRCPECQLIYRYQEWQDGLHNYDNHLILSIELCLYLRHSLQNQIPLPKAINTLESLRGVQFPPAEDLLNAYSHFEAMISLEDTDSLASEGSNTSPSLITELHRKAFLTLHWR